MLDHSDPTVIRRLAKILNAHHSIDGFYLNVHPMGNGVRCNRSKISKDRLLVRSLSGNWHDVTDTWKTLDLRDGYGRSIEPSRLAENSGRIEE